MIKDYGVTSSTAGKLGVGDLPALLKADLSAKTATAVNSLVPSKGAAAGAAKVLSPARCLVLLSAIG
jgi:hypothetical protein